MIEKIKYEVNKLKDAIKIVGILLVGLFVAIFYYPFLHEVGHAIATVMSGAELHEFHILPIPYVLCNINSIGVVSQCLIGVAGMIFPFAISVIIRSSKFWPWFLSLVTKGISALSFGISYLAVLCYDSGIIWCNEDIVKVVQISGVKSSIWLLFSLVMFCLAATVLYLEKPLKKFENYFEIK